MADYYPLIARAVAAAEKNNGETRRAIYERARTALLSQLRGTTPPLSEADITRERLALEEAIRKVEADMVRQARAQTSADATSFPSSGSGPAAPPAERRSLADEALRSFRDEVGLAPRPGGPPAKPPRTGDESGGPVPPRKAESGTQPLPPLPPPPAILRPDPPQQPRPPVEENESDASEPTDGKQALTREERRAQRQARRQARLEAELGGAAASSSPAPVPPARPIFPPPPAPPQPPVSEAPPPFPLAPEEPEEFPETDQAADTPEEEPRVLDSGRSYRGLIMAVIVLLVLGAAGAAAYWQWPAIQSMIQSARAPTAPKQAQKETPSTTQPKITDRLESGQTPGQAQPNAGPVAAVAQRVVLYEEDPADPQGKRYVGSAIWRTETVAGGPGQPPDVVVKADVEVPEQKMAMTWTFRRNTDPALPASHTIEVMFKLPPDFPSGGISNVPGVLMKQGEQERGVPLAGVAVKVTNGYFLIALYSVETEKQRNLKLLKERSWFDIPIVYTNNRRAILAMEKGTPGERAFAEAFAAWGE